MLKPKIFIKSKNKVYDVEQIDFSEKTVEIYDEYYRSFEDSSIGFKNYTFDEVEFMDNTGKKDKNGRYIYTGDIVKVNGWWDCIVKYNQPTCEFLLRSINGTWCLRDSAPFNNISSIEVLGNEYENKELLKLGITEIKSWNKYKMIKDGLKKI